MNNRSQATVVSFLALFITLLSWALGCLMYNSNTKDIQRNLVQVEYTDFIENIRYGMHFGKKLESFYGMSETLTETLQEHSGTEALRVISTDGEVLFQTDETALPEKIASNVKSGIQTEAGKNYFFMLLTENAYLLAEKDAAAMRSDLKARYLKLGLVALAGLAAVELMIFLLWKLVRKGKLGYRLMIVVLTLWIIGFSSYVGVTTYSSYSESIHTIENEIKSSIQTDEQTVEADGVNDDTVTDYEGYFSRYLENVPEIDDISYGKDDELVITRDAGYLRRMAVDYVLQTLLFLAFSAMILTEYQMFMNGLSQEETEENTHA